MILGSCVPEQGIGQKYMNSSKVRGFIKEGYFFKGGNKMALAKSL